MQIDRSDYASQKDGGKAGCFARYKDVIAGDLFTMLVRNRMRNFFDSSMLRRVATGLGVGVRRALDV